MKKQILAVAAAVATVTAISVAPASAAEERTELGVLDCVIEGGAGFIIGSSKDLSCTFTPANDSRPPENYYGVVNKYGLDVGVTDDTIMRWLVLAPTADDYAPGALAGNYVGASADASAGVGGGAKVLIGGSNETLQLQPVSVQGQTGLNIAVGVADFRLRSAAD